MQKFLTILVFIALTKPSISQNNFSFNCRKDTTIECTTSCITLKTTLPNIFSSTTSYTVNQLSALSCFRPYVNPSVTGPSAGLLIDDRYSAPLDISFPFSFYGNTYTKLIASTNGFLSFDISKATAFSHFGILKNGSSLSSTSGIPEDLPSALYDRALIMGPYHDLDPNISTSTQQIKYEVIGTAPYRKWILSYYNVPLYTTACLNLNYNTHQIVLYETLGIVEIFIFDKEICLNWNNGKSMIGLQNFNKTSAIMAPSRSASSAGWGNKGLNESWRFVPAGGQSLFKKVELYTLAGNFIATGTTTALPNNLLDVNFNNICPPPTGESYIVKSFYSDPGNLASDIIGIDTINVVRGDPITVDIFDANCLPNSKGQVVIKTPVGAVYEYSIDGTNWQSSTVFNLAPATYNLRSRIAGTSCISSKVIAVQTITFEASVKIIVIPCPQPVTASIEVFPEHGTPPYLYSLDGGPFQTSNVFTGLVAADYKLVVTDSKGCTYSRTVSIVNEELALAAVTNSICGKAPSGSLRVVPNFGFAPYSYAINGGAFQSVDSFTNLAPGTYNLTVRDSTLCSYTFSATVGSYVVMYANPEIVRPRCYGNADGKIITHASVGVAPYTYALDSMPFQTDSTFKNLKAGSYTLHIKDSSGCILDTTVIVEQPNPVGGSAVIIPATNCLSNDGEITVKANGGNVPYTYSIDSGSTYQASNVFLARAGSFSIIIKDSTGCSTTLKDTVPAIDSKLIVDVGPDRTMCAGDSVILTVTSTQPVSVFNLDSLAGLSILTSQVIVARPADTTTYTIYAMAGICQGFDTVTVNVLHKPIADAGIDTVICNNSFATLRGSAKNKSGSVNYLWTPPRDLATPNSAVTIARPTTTKPTKYRLEVTDNYGCNFKTYDDVVVTMRPAFTPSAGNDTIASIGLPHQLYGSGGVQYLWSPASVLNNPSSQNPVAILQNDTRFTLTARDSAGCVGTSSVMVKVYRGVTYYVPNAFTPNGDGINDIFRIVAPGIKQLNYFKVFNRWGKVVFETNNARNGWDGKYAGIAQPGSVYVWIVKGIDVNGKVIELKGIITLIR